MTWSCKARIREAISIGLDYFAILITEKVVKRMMHTHFLLLHLTSALWNAPAVSRHKTTPLDPLPPFASVERSTAPMPEV